MSGASDRPAVSVVIAAFQEAGAIGEVVRAALAAVPGAEVLVIDDGSTDGTASAARTAGARVLALETNQGKGYAVRHGLSQAAGELIVLIDGDGQDDPAEIPSLLGALRDDVDLVIGSRFSGRFLSGAITPLNRWGNQFLTGAINTLFRTRLTDTQAGFKAFRRSVLRGLSLRARRYDIEVELLLAVLRQGGRVAEVPVRRDARRHGHSHLRSFVDGTRILARIVSMRAGL